MLHRVARCFSSSEAVDCVVIGAGKIVLVRIWGSTCAGVVGLAIARALALQEREVLVLEQSNATGTGISSRNSEGERFLSFVNSELKF